MKVHFKKLISIILIVALVASMLVLPAGASNGTSSIPDGTDYVYVPDPDHGRAWINAFAGVIVAFAQSHGVGLTVDDVLYPFSGSLFTHTGRCSDFYQLEDQIEYYNKSTWNICAEIFEYGKAVGNTCVPKLDEVNGIWRPYSMLTESWVVDINGEFPYIARKYVRGDTEAIEEDAFVERKNGWWLPDELKDSFKPKDKSILDDICATLVASGHDCRLVSTLRFGVQCWVIQDYSTDGGANRIYGNADAEAYVAYDEPSATENEYAYITGDNVTVDGMQVVDINNGTMNLLGDDGTVFTLNVKDLTYDASNISYTVNAYSTTNEGDEYYYTYYTYNIQYNIANTYITYIGSNDAYDKEEYKYYYELPDGRSSADLTADEIAGMSFEFHDVVNYERSATDVSVRALYHFDGDTNDSSYFSTQGKFEWTNGASITYMEAPEAFDGALYLDNTAHSFDIVLPSGLGSADSTIQFRYYQASEPDTQDNIDNFIKIGGTYVLCWDEKTVSRDPDGEHAAWTLPVGTWNEIALVRDDGQLFVYLNGLCVSREAYSTVWGDTITFELGSGSRAYSMIDELRVLNCPITSLSDDYVFVNSIDQCVDRDKLYVLPDGYIYEYSGETQSRLPEGYTEVEYIQSSGTQYIDTRYYINERTDVLLCVNSISSIPSACVVFGSRPTYGSNMFAVFLSSSGVGLNYGSADLGTLCNPGDGAVIEKDGSSFFVNGVLYANLTSSCSTISPTAHIFSMHDRGVEAWFCSGVELEYLKISEDDVLIRDYVPCINPDNEAGLYDLVTNSFYGNDGTGTFSTGAAVSASWTSTGVLYDSLGYGDGASYTPTAVPYDSNLVLVLPDAAKPIADEYWSFNPEGNLLSDYDFTTFSDHSADWYYNPSTTTVLYGDACSVTNNSTLDLAFSVPGYCAGHSTVGGTNGDFVPSNGLVSSLGHMQIGDNKYFNWTTGGYFYRPDLSNTYTLSVVGVDGNTYSHTFTVSAVTTGYEDAISGSDRTYTEFDWGYLFYYRNYNGQCYTMHNRHSIGILPKPGTTFEFVYAELVPGSVANEGHEKVTCVYPESSVQPNTAAIQTTIPVRGYTVGGVRPTLPAKGDCWFPVQENRIQACYIYTGSMWQEVGCRWYTGSRWIPIYAFDLTTLEDLFDIADAADAIVPIISESGFWRWWQLQWLDFRAWFEDALSKIGSSGSGGSSVSGDDIIVILPGESGSFDESGEEQDDGWSFLDLLKAVKDGAWKITKGIVVTGAGGVIGVVGLIGDIGDFFDAYDDSNSESIWGVVNYGGADIWD